jgi:hypothetical protein
VYLFLGVAVKTNIAVVAAYIRTRTNMAAALQATSTVPAPQVARTSPVV